MTETSGVSDTKPQVSQCTGKLVAVPVPDVEARQREPIRRSVDAASLIAARECEPSFSHEVHRLGSIVAGTPKGIREAFDGSPDDGLQRRSTRFDLGTLRGAR